MARKKIGLQVKGLEEYMAKLDEIGGNTAMKRGAEAALKASKQYVNPQITAAMAKPNLPAGGAYSQDDTINSLDKSMAVEWEGLTGKIKVGFDLKKSGLTSIFLMYGTRGTPRHPPMKEVAGLYDAIYGSKTKRQISKLQGEALNKVIKRIMEG